MRMFTCALDTLTCLFIPTSWQVRELLAAGADTSARNKAGKTPLHMASDGSHLEVYRELLASGADIEAKDMFD